MVKDQRPPFSCQYLFCFDLETGRQVDRGGTFVWRPLDTFQHRFPVQKIIFVDGAEVKEGFVGRFGVVFEFAEETLCG